jgi:hypothetical protein
MSTCQIVGCKQLAFPGMRLCEMHVARQANRLFTKPDYSTNGLSCKRVLGHNDATSTIESALLLLLWNRNTTGPFDGGEWLEPESGLAYEFLQDHLRKMLAA